MTLNLGTPACTYAAAGNCLCRTLTCPIEGRDNVVVLADHRPAPVPNDNQRQEGPVG